MPRRIMQSRTVLAGESSSKEGSVTQITAQVKNCKWEPGDVKIQQISFGLLSKSWCFIVQFCFPQKIAFCVGLPEADVKELCLSLGMQCSTTAFPPQSWAGERKEREHRDRRWTETGLSKKPGFCKAKSQRQSTLTDFSRFRSLKILKNLCYRRSYFVFLCILSSGFVCLTVFLLVLTVIFTLSRVKTSYVSEYPALWPVVTLVELGAGLQCMPVPDNNYRQ